MSKKNRVCSIHEDTLSQELGITIERLDEVVHFFDSDPDDEWDLVEGEDYEFISRSEQTRKFSPRGALKIASYLDQHENRSFFYKIKEFITRHDQRLRASFARKIIIEELSDDRKITRVNNTSMIHKQSLRRILETSGARLNIALNDIQRSKKPLVLGVEFVEVESEYWFASSGCVRVATELAENLKDSSRRKACQAVGSQFDVVLKKLESWEARRQKEIENAKKRVKQRFNFCQVTNQKKTKSNKFNLAVHHLYCCKTYPHLAANEVNLLVIKESIHQEFHAHMGGYGEPCQIDDFINFIHDHYPSHDDITIDLNQRKKMLNPNPN